RAAAQLRAGPFYYRRAPAALAPVSRLDEEDFVLAPVHKQCRKDRGLSRFDRLGLRGEPQSNAGLWIRALRPVASLGVGTTDGAEEAHERHGRKPHGSASSHSQSPRCDRRAQRNRRSPPLPRGRVVETTPIASYRGELEP